MEMPIGFNQNWLSPDAKDCNTNKNPGSIDGMEQKYINSWDVILKLIFS